MPLHSVRDVYFCEGELKFRNEHIHKMLNSVSTFVPSGVFEGADSISGYKWRE